MNFNEYRHKIPVQIRFNDIDRVNHVNNACYHTYIELGRVHYFNLVLQREVDWIGEGFVLARTEIDHIKPIFLRDEVFCFTKLVKFGTKSMQLKSVIAKRSGEELVECAVAIGTLVAMNYKTNKSINIPSSWKKLFEKYEKGE